MTWLAALALLFGAPFGGAHLATRWPLWAVRAAMVALLALELSVIAGCNLAAQSDAQGGLAWLGGIPILVCLVTTALASAATAFMRRGEWIAGAIAMVCFVVPAIYFGDPHAGDSTSAFLEQAFTKHTGRTPWEAGHGR